MGEILAFGAEHVAQLTGLTTRQLAYWDRTEFFGPDYPLGRARSPYRHIYSFRDVVGLRTIAILRKTHRIPLQELRRVATWLGERPMDSWANLTFYIAGRRVFFDDPSTGARIATRPLGQTALPIPMQKIVREAQDDSERLRKRSADSIGKVVQHRYVVHNASVIAGTRIPTSAVWNLTQAGYDVDAVIREYPQLTPEDVHIALEYEQGRRHKAV